MDYYRKACDEGNIAEACHRYSALFIRGTKGACDKNMKEAFTYSLKGNFQLYVQTCPDFRSFQLNSHIKYAKMLLQLVNLVISAAVLM